MPGTCGWRGEGIVVDYDRKNLVAAGKVFTPPVLVVALETGLKISLKQRPHISLGFDKLCVSCYGVQWC